MTVLLTLAVPAEAYPEDAGQLVADAAAGSALQDLAGQVVHVPRRTVLPDPLDPGVLAHRRLGPGLRPERRLLSACRSVPLTATADGS